MYSKKREVHGWIVPYHMQVCVKKVKSRITLLYFLLCVCPRLGVKWPPDTDFPKQPAGSYVGRYIQVCVCQTYVYNVCHSKCEKCDACESKNIKCACAFVLRKKKKKKKKCKIFGKSDRCIISMLY